MRSVSAVLLTLAVVSQASASQASDPNGKWKWSVERNDQKIETTLTLKLEGDKLTGSISGRGGTETAIEEASFKDGEVRFQVSRERDGRKSTTKYSGKLDGDVISGKAESGENRSRDWKAERVK
jgi:hypothetical protein